MEKKLFTLVLAWCFTISYSELNINVRKKGDNGTGVRVFVPEYGQKNQTIKLGRRYKEDRLLHEYRATLEGSTKPYGRIQVASTYYPGSKTSRVTCIYLIDFLKDNRQGYGFIYSGGVRQRHAAIVFRSQSKVGLDMACEVYGFDPEPVTEPKRRRTTPLLYK